MLWAPQVRVTLLRVCSLKCHSRLKKEPAPKFSLWVGNPKILYIRSTAPKSLNFSIYQNRAKRGTPSKRAPPPLLLPLLLSLRRHLRSRRAPPQRRRVRGCQDPRPDVNLTLLPPTQIRRKSDLDSSSISFSSDSKAIQFDLEHAFGDSGFSPAGTVTARLKSWSHGGQVRILISWNNFSISN